MANAPRSTRKRGKQSPNKSTAKKSTSDPENLGSPIAASIDNFIRSVDGFRASAPFISLVLQTLRNKHRKDFEQHRDKHGKIVEEKNGEQSINFSPSHASKALELLNHINEMQAAQTTVPNTYLLSLVSQYDAYIGNLLKALFNAKPQIILAFDKQLSFSEISEFRSIKEAKDFIIEKEVEGILRQSHDKQFDVLENTFNIALREGLDIWPEFIELTERRNLLTHTNGKISRQYIAICRKHKVPDAQIGKIGEELTVSPEYFIHAYDVLFEISVKLGHVLWRKILPDLLEEADIHYNSKCYNLIKRGYFDLSIKMLDFICDVEKNTHLRIRDYSWN